MMHNQALRMTLLGVTTLSALQVLACTEAARAKTLLENSGDSESGGHSSEVEADDLAPESTRVTTDSLIEIAGVQPRFSYTSQTKSENLSDTSKSPQGLANGNMSSLVITPNYDSNQTRPAAESQGIEPSTQKAEGLSVPQLVNTPTLITTRRATSPPSEVPSQLMSSLPLSAATPFANQTELAAVNADISDLSPASPRTDLTLSIPDEQGNAIANASLASAGQSPALISTNADGRSRGVTGQPLNGSAPEGMMAATAPTFANQASANQASTPSASETRGASPLVSPSSYRVASGDTLIAIARRLNVSVQTLAQANDIQNMNIIMVGDNLVIPGRSEQPSGLAAPTTSLSTPRAQQSQNLATVSETIGSSALMTAQSGNPQLIHLQSTVQRPIDPASLLPSLQRSAGRDGGTQVSVAVQSLAAAEPPVAPLSATEPVLATAGESTPATDIYTNRLLQGVQTARAHAESEIAPALTDAIAPPTDLARTSTDPASVTPAHLAPRVSNPDWDPRLAAAPLSSDHARQLNSVAMAPLVPQMPTLPAGQEYLPESAHIFNGFVWPAQGRLSSGYGWRWGRMHRGVDIAAPTGTPVVAAAPGVVESAGWNNGGYGNLVDIRHPDGSMTRYAHNHRLLVRAGQTVSQGQLISEIGSTGHSTGPHLHFEVHQPQQGTVNPIAYLPQNIR